MINTDSIREKLKNFVFPIIEKTLPIEQWLKSIYQSNNILTLQLELAFPIHSIEITLKESIGQFLSILHENIRLEVKSNIPSYGGQSGLPTIPGVKNMIAIASGKGGVGKSTTTTQLATALQAEGAKVGILDADIYGPNQPLMLGLNGKPETNEQGKLKPLIAYGMQVMSIGFLIDNVNTPMIWRGPMVSSALQQLLNDTAWEDIDYLLIDLPPGTGDVQLTLAQKIPVTGAVIVTTPQDVALLDVKKAVRMFEKVHIPILGLVENMSYYECPHCQHHESLFGHGGAEKMVAEFQLECLGKIPLQKQIREQSDAGLPILLAEPSHPISQLYRHIAIKLAAELSVRVKKSPKFPKIVIERS